MNVPETFFTVSEQLKLFLLSCLLGVPIGVFYDIFRISRITFKHSKLLVATQDIFVLLVYGAFCCVFTAYCARGEFRFFYVLGNALGFIVYYLTIGAMIVGGYRQIAGKVHALSEKLHVQLKGHFNKVAKQVKKTNEISEIDEATA
jgi:hypothetical protein